MNIHYNQSWYGEKAEVIKKNQNYFVINYGCKGKGIVSNYNLFDGISCCFLDFDTEEVMPSQKFNPDIILLCIVILEDMNVNFQIIKSFIYLKAILVLWEQSIYQFPSHFL